MSFSEEDWHLQLIQEGPEDGLEKSAAADEILEFTKDMKREDGKFYLHINAMGAGEYYGSNRNGDYFPEENLIKWHKTFETSPAHVFRHHVNKDPSIAIGKVIFSFYNHRMHRVELICEVDKVKGAAELAAIEAGNFPMTSMACNTPYDMCSVCGNKAHNRAQYCDHLNGQLNKYLPDGRRVMSLNVGPLKFFDISIVIRPADVTSSVLQKVAGEEQIVVGSLQEAEMAGVNYGLSKKSSFLKEAVEKTADLIKEIPAEISSASDSKDDILNSIVQSVQDPSEDLLEILKDYPLADIIKTFAHMGINPSVEFLIKIIAGKYVGQREGEVADATMHALSESGLESIPESSADLLPEINDSEPNPFLAKILAKYLDTSSYHSEYVEKRASVHTGNINWQTGRGQIQRSHLFNDRHSTDFDPLLQIAGAAIIAKIMISRMAGSKSTGLMDRATVHELRGI